MRPLEIDRLPWFDYHSLAANHCGSIATAAATRGKVPELPGQKVIVFQRVANNSRTRLRVAGALLSWGRVPNFA